MPLNVANLTDWLNKPIEDWTFEEFFKLKDMCNIAIARTPGVVKPWKGTINKGAKDAPEHAETLARITYRMRNIPPVAETLSLADLGMNVGEADKEKTLVKLNIVDLADFVGPLESLNQIATADKTIHSSNEEWMDDVAKFLIGYNAGYVNDHPAVDCELDCGRIAGVLRDRLQLHLRERLVGSITSLRKHWVWRFFAANLGRMAAIVVWFGHTKSGIQIKNAAASGLWSISFALRCNNDISFPS